MGRLLLWALLVGFAGLAIWQLTEAIVGRGETSDRAKAGSKFVLCAALAWTSFSFAKGGGTNSKEQTTDSRHRSWSTPGDACSSARSGQE